MGEQESLCVAFEHRYQSVPDCYKRAESAVSTSQQRALLMASKAIAAKEEYEVLHRKFAETINRISNPTEAFRDWILPKLPRSALLPLDMFDQYANERLGKYGQSFSSAEALSNVFIGKMPFRPKLTLTPFERNPELSKRGDGLVYELFAALHNGTVGNSSLHSKNPVIAAIQGTTAKELAKIHSNLFGELDQTTNLLDSMILADSHSKSLPALPAAMRQSSPSRAAGEPVGSSRSTQVEDPDCSLLDRPSRTDLAVQEPERFERLVERCGKSR